MPSASRLSGRNGSKTKSNRQTQLQTEERIAQAKRNLNLWTTRYVLGSIAGSSLLNGYQSYIDGGAGFRGIFGALIGIAIPLAVWTLAKCAGWSFRSGLTRVGIVIALVGAGLLVTSLAHVSTAIATLTGSGLWLATAVAIGIDCGLVATEAAAILVEDHSR